MKEFNIDGVETGSCNENLSHTPNKEAFEAFGDTFFFDYVRVFDKVD